MVSMSHFIVVRIKFNIGWSSNTKSNGTRLNGSRLNGSWLNETLVKWELVKWYQTSSTGVAS